MRRVWACRRCTTKTHHQKMNTHLKFVTNWKIKTTTGSFTCQQLFLGQASDFKIQLPAALGNYSAFLKRKLNYIFLTSRRLNGLEFNSQEKEVLADLNTLGFGLLIRWKTIKWWQPLNHTNFLCCLETIKTYTELCLNTCHQSDPQQSPSPGLSLLTTTSSCAAWQSACIYFAPFPFIWI